MQSPELYIAFVAGLLSFLSPCVLPLVPAYIGYLSGTAMRTVTAGGTVGGGTATATMPSSSARWIVLMHALVFVLGFTLVFAVLGGLVGSLRGVFAQYHVIIERVMGTLLVIFGLHMIGLINVPFLNYERRLGDKLRPAYNLGYLRSLLIGIGFAAGWTPCIGPTLGLIFSLAVNGQQGDAVVPFLAYSVGLGVPFLATALAMGRISTALKRLTRKSYSLKIGDWLAIDQVNIVSLVSGGLLVIMGILVFGNWLTLLAPPINGFGNV